MMLRITGLMLAMMFIAVSQAAEMKLDTDKLRFSYTIGVQIGDSLQRDKLDVDAAAIALAIGDVMSQSSLKLSAEQMQAAIKLFQEQKTQEMMSVAEDNLKKGRDFMLKYSKKKGVTSLENGLYYKVLKKGSGKKPVAEDSVVVNYRGTLITGEEFDSSYKRGKAATFGVSAVIEGWQEILPMMAVGSKWEIVIPSELAYGQQQAAGGMIGPNSTLIFEIELLEIK